MSRTEESTSRHPIVIKVRAATMHFFISISSVSLLHSDPCGIAIRHPVAKQVKVPISQSSACFLISEDAVSRGFYRPHASVPVSFFYQSEDYCTAGQDAYFSRETALFHLSLECRFSEPPIKERSFLVSSFF